MLHLSSVTKIPSLLLTMSLLAALFVGILSLHNNLPPPAQGKRPALPSDQAQPPISKPTLLFDEKEMYGRYYFGDGLGVNCSLALQADHHFDFKWTGCLGEYDRNAGVWELQGDVLMCKPSKPNRREGPEGMNLRFLPVKWGNRYYLVDENEMPGFCAAMAAKEIPDTRERHGLDYLKYEAGTLPPYQGVLLLPERYRTFYEKGAIQAKVVSTDSTGQVTLNKGSAERVKPQMLFTINAFENCEVKIIRVTEHTSVGQGQYSWNSGRWVKVGDRLTTGDYWHRPHGTGFQVFSKPPGLLEKRPK